MTEFDNIYDVEPIKGEDSLKYIFVSKGANHIIKVIAYDYVQELNGLSLFNLGFGDYDIETDKINDTTDTNNGDHYKVFFTVLNTVPSFFAIKPNAIVAVQGSDHGVEFMNNCKKTCKKNCQKGCKNINRRIKTYRYFIEKNYNKLIENFRFFGGTRIEKGVLLHDDYKVGEPYDLVFCIVKK